MKFQVITLLVIDWLSGNIPMMGPQSTVRQFEKNSLDERTRFDRWSLERRRLQALK